MNDNIKSSNSAVNSGIANASRGATMVEYALLVALIAIVAIAAITVFGNKLSTKFSSIGSQL